MPRRPRIHLAGLLLHIVQRGHNCKACFFGDRKMAELEAERIEPAPKRS
jgi:hypothetical protein